MDANSSQNASPASWDMVYMATVFRDPVSSRALAFSCLLLIYLLTVVGNPLLALVIFRDRALHKPMYVFMSCLAVADVAESSTIVPRIMRDLTSASPMPLAQCVAQMCFIHVSLRMQGYLLAAMSVDRYLAICHPLSYHRLVSNSVAALACGAIVLLSVLLVAGNLALVVPLRYCKRIVMMYPSCDFLALSNLSCSDVRANSLYGLLTSIVTVFGPLCAVGLMYGLILVECRKPALRRGQRKALRTCVTHLAVLLVFFTSLLFTVASGLGLFPSLSREARVSLLSLYQVVPPALNPVIYGLRTAHIRRSLGQILRGRGDSVRPAAAGECREF